MICIKKATIGEVLRGRKGKVARPAGGEDISFTPPDQGVHRPARTACRDCIRGLVPLLVANVVLYTSFRFMKSMLLCGCASITLCIYQFSRSNAILPCTPLLTLPVLSKI